MSEKTVGEVVHMKEDMALKFGKEILKAVTTLPPSMSGPIRNPDKKHNSTYKVYEWMALLHWYIIPIAWELGFNRQVLANFAEFVNIVEVAMSHTPKSDIDLVSLYTVAMSFLEGFERLYVHDDPIKVSRCRLCIWQLIHVLTHIAWNGSIRFGSQATVERAIGEIGHKVRSKKAPFANIATMLFERANGKVLRLKYPSLVICPKEKRQKGHLYQSLLITTAEMNGPSEYYHHLAAICDHLPIEFDLNMPLQRWGKHTILGDVTLRSKISELRGQASRSSRYFEVETKHEPVFGEALAFYYLPEQDCSLVVYHELIEKDRIFGRWFGEWSKDYMVMKTSSISKLVGIWRWEQRVHILRQHADLEMLNVENYEIEEQEEE